jgi:hypothetical protein
MAGAVVALILLAVYLPMIASPAAESAATRQVMTHTALAATGVQQALPQGPVTGSTKVLILQQASSYIEVRSEKGLAAYINATEDNFEAHIASDENGLAAYIKASSTATPVALASPPPAPVFTYRVIIDTDYYTDGPQQARPADGTLAAGAKVSVLQWAGSYVQVRTEDGIEAYIVADSIVPLEDAAQQKQEEWQPAVLQDGWQNVDANFNPAGYFKDSQGIVHLRGVVQNTSGASLIGKAIFSLPPDYSPEQREIHTTIAGTANEIGRIDILPSVDAANGSVILMKGSPEFISLDGITFRAK